MAAAAIPATTGFPLLLISYKAMDSQTNDTNHCCPYDYCSH